MYHNGCVHHIVDGDDLEWPRTHNPGSLRQLLYRCTCCTCCTGTLGTAGTAAVQHTHIGQQLVYAVPAVPLYLLYRCTAVPAVPPGLRRAGTPAAQRGSAVACDERFLPPPVTARESFVLRYPRCEQRTSSQRVALRCKSMYTAKPRVQSSTVHHAPPCARRRGSDMFFGLYGNVWHPRCDRRPAILEIRIRAAHHCAPGLALCHAVRG